jgi:hypothetical protein
MFSHRYLRHYALVFVMAFVLEWLAVACASVTPAGKSNAQPADNTLNSEQSAASADSATNHVDATQDIWAKQHAAYLRTLDFAQIDQQKNIPAVYSLKTDIIDSRYHIRNSETDLTVEHNARSALRELRSAKQLFDRAVANANGKERPLLDDPKTMLDDLIKQTELSMQNKCDSPGQDDYHLLELKLENLLAAL